MRMALGGSHGWEEEGGSFKPTSDNVMITAAAEMPDRRKDASEKARQLVFFIVQMHKPGIKKRTKILGQGDLGSLSIVICQRLLEMDIEHQNAVVSLSPLNLDSKQCAEMPLTINLRLLSTAELLAMRRWEAD